MMQSIIIVFKAEMLQFVRTGKGLLFAGIIILLSLSCAITAVIRYNAFNEFIVSKNTEYEERIKASSKEGAKGLINQKYSCINKPTPLCMISGARRIEAPREYVFTPSTAYWMVLMSSWLDPMQQYLSNPPPVFEMKEFNLDASFIDFDFTFIVQLFIPFCLILIGFDTVCRDRSEGKLRLTIITASSRMSVWAGKWLFLAIVVLLSLTISALIYFPIARMSLIGTWEHFASTSVIILFVSAGYLIFWSFLILLVSTVVNSGSKSLTSLITILLLFNIVIPCTIRLTVKQNSLEQYRDVWASIGQAVLHKTTKFKKEEVDFGGDIHWNLNERGLEQADKISIFINQMAVFIEKNNIEYDRRCIDQLAKAEKVSLVSPSLLFRYICENSCGSGIDNFYRFNNAILNYNKTMFRFIQELDQKDHNSKHGFYFNYAGFCSTKPVSFEDVPKFVQPNANGLQKIPIRQLLIALLLTCFSCVISIIAFMRLNV